jgi:hypothetical protein
VDRSRSVVTVLSLAAALASSTLALGQPAEAGGSFASDTNALRASHGLAAYRVCDDLDALAADWAAHMAATETLEHNPDLTGEVAGWQSLGENVGTGPNEATVQAAFVHSAEHYANLTSGSFTEAGFGTAVSADGHLWVDEIFRTPQGSACAGSSGGLASTGGSFASPDTSSYSSSYSSGGDGAASRSLKRGSVVPSSPTVPVNPSIARTAEARTRLMRISITPAPPRDVVAAALAFAKAMTVS